MITILTNTYQMYEPPAPPSGIVELDMGCGKGGYTLALAERYPDRLILGSDVMLGRLRRIERKIERRGLTHEVDRLQRRACRADRKSVV